MRDKKDYLYLEIETSLRRQILDGNLKAGERLPTVRELAVQWGCTAGTVERAYQRLREAGLVEGRAGKGTLVTARPAERQPGLGWAGLIHKAEALLLEALQAGYTAAEAETALAAAVLRWQELQRQPDIPGGQKQTSIGEELRFSGSHDLAVELMPRLFSETGGPGDEPVRLVLNFCGSLGGLMELAQGKADLAGTHLWDEVSQDYNLGTVQRILPGQRAALITLAHRAIGLMTPAGNPKGIRSIGDLGREGVRIINRQAGSGMRVWFDGELEKAGLRSEGRLEGYAREAQTHLGAAQAVMAGAADVGFGIAAAAGSYGLDFIPLQRERYEIVILEDKLRRPAGEKLVQVLQSGRMKALLEALGGYETGETGNLRWSR